MFCDTAREWMSLHLDGMLDELKAKALGEHLSHCLARQQEWQAIQQMSALLEKVPMAVPSADFTAEVIRRLETRQRPGKKETRSGRGSNTAIREALSNCWQQLGEAATQR